MVVSKKSFYAAVAVVATFGSLSLYAADAPGAIGAQDSSLTGLAKDGDLGAKNNGILGEIKAKGLFKTAAERSKAYKTSRINVVVDTSIPAADNLAEQVSRTEAEAIVEPATLASGAVWTLISIPTAAFSPSLAKQYATVGAYQVVSVGTDAEANVERYITLFTGTPSQQFKDGEVYYVTVDGAAATFNYVKNGTVSTYTAFVAGGKSTGQSAYAVGKALVLNPGTTGTAAGNFIRSLFTSVGNDVGTVLDSATTPAFKLAAAGEGVVKKGTYDVAKAAFTKPAAKVAPAPAPAPTK